MRLGKTFTCGSRRQTCFNPLDQIYVNLFFAPRMNIAPDSRLIREGFKVSLQSLDRVIDGKRIVFSRKDLDTCIRSVQLNHRHTT